MSALSSFSWVYVLLVLLLVFFCLFFSFIQKKGVVGSFSSFSGNGVLSSPRSFAVGRSSGFSSLRSVWAW